MLIKNLFRHWTYQVFSPGTILREKYESFKDLLEHDKAAHEFMASLEDIYYTQKKCDFQAVVKTYEQFADSVSKMVEELLKMSPSSYWSLKSYFKKFDFYIRFMIAPKEFEFSPPFTIKFDKISSFNETMAGKKALSLSRLNKDLNLPAPHGFVITTNAFHYFLETNRLKEPINERLANLDISDTSSLELTALEIEQLIVNAIVPEDIDTAITDSMESLGKGMDFRVALRSSAAKEDGRASFAGQYLTLLNVEKKKVLKGYKQIIASKYSAQALFYRISHGILDDETPMAVLVLEMIDSQSSGVIYTRDIEEPLSDNLLIHSVWGQGGLLVEGEVSPDLIKVSKIKPKTIVSTKTAAKLKVMVLAPDIQTQIIDTDQQQQNLLSLDKVSALTLATWGISLEAYFNEPQDIEWCQDKSGKLFILQSRPLNMPEPYIQKIAESTQVPEDKLGDKLGDKIEDKTGNKIDHKIICSKGEQVYPGIGSGPVFILEQLSQLNQIPQGSVLVVRHGLPQFVTAINKINGIIIATGSRASHFASIAREFGVPSIVNVTKGFHDLIPGSIVTVDADNCIVYEGKVKSPRKEAIPKDNFFQDSSFMNKLQYVINFCTKLKLTDPESSSFVPEACRSLHDIIRFTHETAVKGMFLGGNRKGNRKKGAKKLISGIPMLFYVLDVGQGIKDVQKNNILKSDDLKNKKQLNEKFIKPEDIASIPMKFVLKGLSDPAICWSETSHFDWEEYDRIVMAGGIISADAPQFGSYAVVSKEYLNVNFRFGYHFVILDTICTDSKKDNYILFRFSGGGGSPAGKARRASFIKGILTRLNFLVQIKSDLIDAEFKHGSLKTMEKTLEIIGRLLGATKLMDMYLKENMPIEQMVDDFMNGRYDFRPNVEEEL
jgi:pyruvate,water dikinase